MSRGIKRHRTRHRTSDNRVAFNDSHGRHSRPIEDSEPTETAQAEGLDSGGEEDRDKTKQLRCLFQNATLTGL
jgi:hypothetical protein